MSPYMWFQGLKEDSPLSVLRNQDFSFSLTQIRKNLHQSHHDCYQIKVHEKIKTGYTVNGFSKKKKKS